MKIINDTLKKYNLCPFRYERNGNATIVDTNEGKYVLKSKVHNEKIYAYLNSRAFHYYPENISKDDDIFDIFEYIENYSIPNEQRAVDLIDLVSLLHNKTTHYKEITEDEYKKIYEDITNNILYLESYYNDMITIIDTEVYPGPAEYLFARNFSKIISALSFCKNELDKWYEKVKKSQKKRLVIIHNNLSLKHFFRNNNSYLISWDKSRIDMPIFDLYKLYRNDGLDIEFSSLLRRYEKNYPLLEEERQLLFILMSMPEKVEFITNEYECCKKVTRMIDYIYKAESIVSPYYTKKEETK